TKGRRSQLIQLVTKHFLAAWHHLGEGAKRERPSGREEEKQWRVSARIFPLLYIDKRRVVQSLRCNSFVIYLSLNFRRVGRVFEAHGMVPLLALRARNVWWVSKTRPTLPKNSVRASWGLWLTSRGRAMPTGPVRVQGIWRGASES